MLRAALTLGFFGFLKVREFTVKYRSFDPRFHPTRWEHALLHQAVQDRPGGQGYHHLHCVYQGQAHVSSGSNGGLQRMLSLFHSLITHFRDERPLTPKSFHSTFLSLVDQCGYDPAKYNTHSSRIGAATAATRAGLPTDTIQKLGRWRTKAYWIYNSHLLTLSSKIKINL